MRYFWNIALILIIIGSSSSKNESTSTTKKIQVSGAKKPPTGKSSHTTNLKNSDIDSQFKDFKKKYNKNYSSRSEEVAAKKAFQKNVQNDMKHNRNKTKTFKRGTNSYSDKDHAWKVSNRMGARKPKNTTQAVSSLPTKSPSLHTRMGESEAIPDSANWTDWMSPVRDQADCGVCWVYASLAVLEYLTIVIREQLTDLSAQEILDCNLYDGGCDGGWPSDSFKYIVKNGVTTERSYPYLSYQSDCLATRFARNLIINETFEEHLNGDEEQLKYIVYNYGPTVVVIYASEDFTQYSTGVFSELDCPNSPNSFNHAVTIVGYGTSPTQGDFWIFKNSWGTDWGEYGYGRIARNQGNMCGIANYAMNPSSSWISETNINLRTGRK